MQQLVPRLLFCLRNSLAEKKKEVISLWGSITLMQTRWGIIIKKNTTTLWGILIHRRETLRREEKLQRQVPDLEASAMILYVLALMLSGRVRG